MGKSLAVLVRFSSSLCFMRPVVRENGRFPHRNLAYSVWSLLRDGRSPVHPAPPPGHPIRRNENKVPFQQAQKELE
jgi:hypothetical protein